MNKKLILLILASLLFYYCASAEVLDKFGGCQIPQSIIYLSGFCILIMLLLALKKKQIAQWTFIISCFYVIWYVAIPFLGAHYKWNNIVSSARRYYYDEINACPQYEVIGYWSQTWLATMVYFVTVSLCFFWQARRKR